MKAQIREYEGDPEEKKLLESSKESQFIYVDENVRRYEPIGHKRQTSSPVRVTGALNKARHAGYQPNKDFFKQSKNDIIYESKKKMDIYKESKEI